MEITQIFYFGFGYTAQHLADRLKDKDKSKDKDKNITMIATAKSSAECAKIEASGIKAHIFNGEAKALNDKALEDLLKSSHLLISIPPPRNNIEDYVLNHHGKDITSPQSQIKRIIYLSTVGVYGNHRGSWVNESTKPTPLTTRSLNRLKAEKSWLNLAHDASKAGNSNNNNLSSIILRLSGIYGTGRSALDRLKNHQAKIIIKEAQIFNRIHIDDITTAIHKAMTYDGNLKIFNITDDTPSPPQDVTCYAAQLLGLTPPVSQQLEEAKISAMSKSFYSESKRVENHLMKKELKVKLKYPSYKTGLKAIINKTNNS